MFSPAQLVKHLFSCLKRRNELFLVNTDITAELEMQLGGLNEESVKADKHKQVIGKAAG